jgi:hypothetical protein
MPVGAKRTWQSKVRGEVLHESTISADFSCWRRASYEISIAAGIKDFRAQSAWPIVVAGLAGKRNWRKACLDGRGWAEFLKSQTPSCPASAAGTIRPQFKLKPFDAWV